MLLFAFTSLFALPLSDLFQWSSWGVSLAFLGLTGGFLIRDLDRPDRFSSVMLRPQFKSWLVRGGYTITGFGGLLALWGIAKFLGVEGLRQASLWGGALFALLTSVYTAFLFSAAKGRDFWQSPLLALHMLVTSLLAGGSAMIILAGFSGADGSLQGALRWGLVAGLIVDSLIIFSELYGRHPSKQAGETAHVITHGSLRQQFWIGCMLAGHLLPFVLLLATPSPLTGGLAAILALGGVYYTEKLWIKAPQLISLS